MPLTVAVKAALEEEGRRSLLRVYRFLKQQAGPRTHTYRLSGH